MCFIKIGGGIIVLENFEDLNKVNFIEIIWINEMGW